MKTLDDAEKVTAAELRGMTPPQVDELFSVVYDVDFQLYMRQERIRRRLLKHAENESGTSRKGFWVSASPDELKQWNDELEGTQKQRDYLAAHVESKLAVEYTRRGGWPRAYLVTDGHAHKTTECSTCHKGEYRTKFSWLIDYSGKSEKEIVDAAGDRACTVCYPSAPVAKGLDAPKSVMLTPEEVDRDKARQDREDKKAAAAAAKAAKAITAVDGAPLKVHTWTKKAHQEQRGNKIVDVPEQEFFETIKTLHAARGWLTDRFDTWRSDTGHRDLKKVAEAVALKELKTVDQVIEEAKARARKRK